MPVKRCVYCRNKRRPKQRTCRTCHARLMVVYRRKAKRELEQLKAERVA